jgi:DNA-binding GntR family transcriptional regulator
MPTRKQEVLASLREQILDGRLPPGTVLNEVALSREFGVSVTPVREAVLELVADGLATRAANHRARVAPFGRSEFADGLDIMGLIAGAVVRRAGGRVDADDRRRAAEVLRRFGAAMDSGDRAASDATIEEALRILAAATHNGELNALLDAVLHRTLARMRRVSFRPVGELWAEHASRVADLLEEDRLPDAAETLEEAYRLTAERYPGELEPQPQG